MSEGLVCGFSDEATGLACVAWSLGGHGGALLAHAGDVGAAEATPAPDGDGLRLAFAISAVEIDAELSAGDPIELRDPEGRTPLGAPSVAPCTASVRAGPTKAKCAGTITRWAEDPADGAELLRHVVLPAADDASILVIARRPQGASDHGEEAPGAWRVAGGAVEPFFEALLSTEYDGAGSQTRAGFELWPTDHAAPPVRGAATLLGFEAAAGGVGAALMRSAVDGVTGIGSYLIRRP